MCSAMKASRTASAGVAFPAVWRLAGKCCLRSPPLRRRFTLSGSIGDSIASLSLPTLIAASSWPNEAARSPRIPKSAVADAHFARQAVVVTRQSIAGDCRGQRAPESAPFTPASSS